MCFFCKKSIFNEFTLLFCVEFGQMFDSNDNMILNLKMTVNGVMSMDSNGLTL